MTAPTARHDAPKRSAPTKMLAARFHARGEIDSISIDSIPRPRLREGEVLVRIEASAITPGELLWEASWTTRDGKPRTPAIPAHELVGVVEESAVAALSPNTRVFGLLDFWRDGAAAEYALARADELAHAPVTLDPLHAAATPLSALTAWQALFDHGRLRAGERILIHGGAGGVGSLAVQFARSAGAEVVATTDGGTVELVRRLGAHRALDYRTTVLRDALDDELDLVLDTVGGETLAESFAITRRGGRIVSIVEPPDEELAAAAGVDARMFVVHPDSKELATISKLIDRKRISPIIDRVFDLRDAAAAFAHMIDGHRGGKVVLRV